MKITRLLLAALLLALTTAACGTSSISGPDVYGDDTPVIGGSNG